MKFELINKLILSLLVLSLGILSAYANTNARACPILDLESLSRDLDRNPDLLKAIEDQPELADAWQVISNSPNRTDVDFVKFFNDADVISARGTVEGANIKSKFPDLSVEELTSIYHYTTEAYAPLNRGLRTRNVTPHLDAFNKSLNKSLDKLPKYTQPTYRGTKLKDNIIEQYRLAFVNKNTIKDEAFFSTSKDFNVAESFADDVVGQGETKVFFEINGNNGVDIEDISAYGPSFNPSYSESEILFKSGTAFDVTDFSEDVLPNGEKYIRIILKE